MSKPILGVLIVAVFVRFFSVSHLGREMRTIDKDRVLFDSKISRETLPPLAETSPDWNAFLQTGFCRV